MANPINSCKDRFDKNHRIDTTAMPGINKPKGSLNEGVDDLAILNFITANTTPK